VNLSAETDDEGYVVFAAVPGSEREELDLRVEDGLLTSHRSARDERALRTRLARSRRVREQVRLPGGIDVDGIAATYRNGVLEVHLSADASEDSRSIEID
jgi:HSP20 family protein